MEDNKDVSPIPMINREISWLYFNERVLQEAADKSVPLIERLRFLAIFSSNLDEFYRVRVATLSRLASLSIAQGISLGFSPKRTLVQVKQLVIRLEGEFDTLYQEIHRELAREKIFIINYKEIDREKGAFIRKYFNEQVLSKLVPIILNDGISGKKPLPFPHLNEKKTYLFVKLFKKKKSSFSLLEVPYSSIQRFLVLPHTGQEKFIILLDDVIRYCLDDVYPIFNHDKIQAFTFQLTRDSELDLDSHVNEAFVEVLTKGLQEREVGKPMRLLYEKDMPEDMVSYLVNHIHLSSEMLIPSSRYANFKDFINFPDLGRSDLAYPYMPPLMVKGIHVNKSIFNQMAAGDFLLCPPYHTYDYVLHFLREAAIDPKVLSIHITLYRLADNSSVINALINAAKNGKKVQVFVELKARFDEKANIYWSKKLSKVGVQVRVALGEYKVHSKVCLVKRREKGKVVHYATLATGNFNEVTARIYCDFNLFTVRKEIVDDLKRFFRGLRNGKFYQDYNSLITSPLEMRDSLYQFIDREVYQARKGKLASMIIKMNSLTDEGVINKLYEASNAGVKIQLIVRGMCCLIPGQQGFSENITVRSIVDRYLEHARVWIFENGGKEEIYLTSADFMSRNLDRRIEITFPILDPRIKRTVRDLIEIQLRDNVKARAIDKDNLNLYIRGEEGTAHRAQLETYAYLKEN